MAMERDNGKTPGNGDAARDTAAVIRAAFRMPSDAEMAPGDAPGTAQTYRRIMDDYREHGRRYLASGDYRQAAEKNWGAFAESVKSIAADYGMKISSHATIVNVAGRLSSLAAQDNPEAGRLLHLGLGLARSLHQHFYEDDLPAESVIYSAGVVAEAIDLMQRRFGLGNNGAAPEGE